MAGGVTQISKGSSGGIRLFAKSSAVIKGSSILSGESPLISSPLNTEESSLVELMQRIYPEERVWKCEPNPRQPDVSDRHTKGGV